MTISKNRLVVRSALLCSTAFMAAPAFAQETSAAAAPAGQQAAADEAREGGLEDIVVTARKRNENLQNIPVAETVISKAQIDNLSINTVEKIAALAPQLIVSRNGSGNGASIGLRGVSVNATSISLEQSVAIVVDGVYYSGGRALNIGMFDLQQAEVLKGPQSLFYGKNTTAGAISLTTADPTKDFQAMLRGGYEFRGHNPYAEGYISGPITDSLSFRIAGRYTKQFDALIKNLSTAQTTYTKDIATGVTTQHTYPGADNTGERSTTIRASLKFDPGSGFTATLKNTYNKYDSNTPNSAAVIAVCEALGHIQTDANAPCGHKFEQVQGAVPGDIAATLPFAGRKGGRPYLDFKEWNSTLNLEYATDQVTFNLTPAYTVWTDYWNGDFDFTDGYLSRSPTVGGSGGNNGNTREQQRAFSLEGRAQTHFSGGLNVMVGGYYQKSDLYFSQENIFPGGVDNSAASQTKYRYLTVYKDGVTHGNTYAAFGQLLWDITSQLNVTAGARYTHETKSSSLNQPYVYPGSLGSFAVAKIAADQTFDNFSPEGTISYKPVSNVTVYASYKTGYKSGGFSISGTISPQTQASDAAFQPEKVRGFEGGVKSTLFGNQLRLNADVFHYIYSGLQVDYFDPLTIRYFTLNAGKARTQGAELDLEFSPYSAPGLTLRGSFAYTDAIYTSFGIAPCVGGQRVNEGCNLAQNTTTLVYTKQSLTGQETPQAPPITATASVDYTTPISDGLKIGFSLNGRYSDRYKIYAFAPDSASRFYQNSYATIDASIRLFSEANKWELALIGKNLTNHFIESSGFDLTYTGSGAGTATGVHADTRTSVYDPRTIAVQATVRF
jgi:iron complex outermembrane receptor protein